MGFIRSSTLQDDRVPNAVITSFGSRALLAVRPRPSDAVPTMTFESVSWIEFQYQHSWGHSSPWPIRWKHIDSTAVALECEELAKVTTLVLALVDLGALWLTSCGLALFSSPPSPAPPNPQLGSRGGTPAPPQSLGWVFETQGRKKERKKDQSQDSWYKPDFPISVRYYLPLSFKHPAGPRQKLISYVALWMAGAWL